MSHVIHYAFRKNPNNGFTSVFSKAIIYSLGILAIVHASFLFFRFAVTAFGKLYI